MKIDTKDEIIEEIRESVEQHACSAQRFRQLKSALSASNSPAAGDALLECWQTLTSPDEQFVEQEFVAGLLFVLSPATSLTIGQVLAGSPELESVGGGVSLVRCSAIRRG